MLQHWENGLVIYWAGAHVATLVVFCSADVDQPASLVPLMGTFTSVS